MDCDEFLQQLNECIDRRVPVTEDRSLRQHVDHCPECRDQWLVWQSIESTLDRQGADLCCQTSSDSLIHSRRLPTRNSDDRGHRPLMRLWIAATLMGVVLSGSIGIWRNQSSRPDAAETMLAVRPDSGNQIAKSALPTTSIPSADQHRLHQTNGFAFESSTDDIETTPWWQRTDPEQWIDQSMPTFRLVQQSVAPLGRSLMQAVAILTTRPQVNSASGGQAS